jgi:filamentous hemagglutinin family protein
MITNSFCHFRRVLLCGIFLAYFMCRFQAQANPTGGTVTQGAATFSSAGSQLTINQSTASAFINWQSFNINAGEGVTFNQPSSSSVTWNFISDPSASTINGALNANGIVVLQNPNGFIVGGLATINAHGLVMTTAASSAINFSSDGPWSFAAAPPTAKIVNYGQINISGGGSAFLIASDIENNGTISAPGGNIGLYAGEKVLVSTSPNGLGLSAQVTLPEGSVDNTGKLIADGGSIAALAQMVNQNGLVQANSVKNVNGTIELVAGDSVNLGANSIISAQGDAQGVSAGGSVTIKGGNSFSDQTGSSIDVAGGSQGGNGGQVEISAPQMGAINTVIDGQAQDGFIGGILTIDPTYIWLDSADNAPSGYTFVDINSFNGPSQINVQADDDIVLNAAWVLGDQATPSTLNLSAGNNITVNDGAGIQAGQNWTLNLTAGTALPSGTTATSGNDEILLNGSASIQAANGNINLSASGNIATSGSSTISANGGNLILQAPTVDQAGTLQANSVGSANGVVEIDASQDLILESSSKIYANGDPSASSASPGGFVVLNAGNTYSDVSGSTISVSGTAGGQGGIVEIFDPQAGSTPIQTTVSPGYFAYLVNPYDVTLSGNSTGTSYDTSHNLDANFDVNDVNDGADDLGVYSQIDLRALDNIELSTAWMLNGSTPPAILSLTAGNDIIVDDGTGIQAGQNWNVTLNAGTALPSGMTDVAGTGNYRIFLYGTGFIQAENGNINLYAPGDITLGTGGITTIGVSDANGDAIIVNGGNISVTSEYGNVDTGTGINGFNYHWNGNGTAADPYYTPFALENVGQAGVFGEYIYWSQSQLSGISTAAGGNVTINAPNGSVISYPTDLVPENLNGELDEPDPGTGAFGSQAGNVTINAGGNVYGNFIIINGAGTITAGGSIGTSSANVALSLAGGGWTLNAGQDVYLQEVRNPNGTFNDTETGKLPLRDSAGYHVYDYSATAYVNLTAGDGVYFADTSLPRVGGNDNEGVYTPLILPPIVNISAGAEGVTLETPGTEDENGQAFILPDFDIVLFPSPYGNLTINTSDGGSLIDGNAKDSDVDLRMSDSDQKSWFAPQGTQTEPFSAGDNGSTPPQLGDTDPVILNITGSINLPPNANTIPGDMTIQVDEAANITVGGNIYDFAFYGENLLPSDVTSITVHGQIDEISQFTSITLADPLNILPTDALAPGTANDLADIFNFALNPANLASVANTPIGNLQSLLYGSGTYLELKTQKPNLAYDPSTLALTVNGALSPSLVAALEGPLVFPIFGPNGLPEESPSGQLETQTFTLIPVGDDKQLSTLITTTAPIPSSISEGFILGGPGQFNVTAAGSISLGTSYGIISVGNGTFGSGNYSDLGPTMVQEDTLGASISVTSQAGYLEMPSSTIAALGGGSVTVDCYGEDSDGVSMDLGSQILAPLESQISAESGVALGIYTTGGGAVNVEGYGTINVDTSLIATLNGGDITVKSDTGDVDAGSGGMANVPINVYSPYFSPASSPYFVSLRAPYNYEEFPDVGGIDTETLVNAGQLAGAATTPGNITIETPEGDIDADVGGILQESLSGVLLPGPVITLEAGTPVPAGDWTSKQTPLYVGNINLGDSGAIGGSIVAEATGNINGLLISQQNSDIVAQQSFSGTVLSGGTANVSAGGSVGGVIIGGSGVNVAGSGTVSATLLGQNVSVNGGASQSTLGNTATATATSQAAAQQSTQSAAQQVASNGNGDDDEKKKKKKATIHVGRVTVLLSAAVPRH